MSEIAIGRTLSDGAFKSRTMLVVAAVGILAFIAMLVLGAYAPDLRSSKNGGAHALSNAATGFSGLVRLAEATGRNPHVVRFENELDGEALLVITPETPWTHLDPVFEHRGGKVTLVVLPKWDTERDRKRTGWVRSSGLVPKAWPEGVLAPGDKLTVGRTKGQGRMLTTVRDDAPPEMRFLEPAVVQSIAGDKVEPIVTDAEGRIVLGRLGDRPVYVLADPDLINNRGMGDIRQAGAALAMLDFLNSTGSEEVLFDVTLNGLGGTRSPLRLAFDPPFLAVTIALFTALLLAGLQGIARFGAPLRPQREIAFGKAALVDNSASLVRKAGREARLGWRYSDIIRERAAAIFRLPAFIRGEELDAKLDELRPDKPFSKLAAAASTARSRDELVAAARALHHWVEEAQA